MKTYSADSSAGASPVSFRLPVLSGGWTPRLYPGRLWGYHYYEDQLDQLGNSRPHYLSGY